MKHSEIVNNSNTDFFIAVPYQKPIRSTSVKPSANQDI